MEPIDNFKLIYPLLDFSKEDSFYMISLILRKKDQTTTFGNTNNSARIIRNYYVYTEDYLRKKENEIKELCNLFKCRAGIILNKRSDEQLAFSLNKELANRLEKKDYKVVNIVDSVIGSLTSKDKTWIIDFDLKCTQSLVQLINIIRQCKSEYTDPIVNILDTYSGHHIITKPFDVKDFIDRVRVCGNPNLSTFKADDIHKNNPAALYYPVQNP